MFTKNLLQSQSSVFICRNIPRSSRLCFELFFAVICLSTTLPSFPSFSQPGKDSNAELGLPGFALGMTLERAAEQALQGELFWVVTSMRTHDITMFLPYLIVWRNTTKRGTFVSTGCLFLK